MAMPNMLGRAGAAAMQGARRTRAMQYGVGPFSDANYFGFTGADPAFDMGPGRSLVLVLNPTSANQTHDTIPIAYYRGAFGSGVGWFLYIYTAGSVAVGYRPSILSTSIATATRVPGRPCRIVVSHTSGGQIKGSADGEAVASAAMGAYLAGDGTTNFRLGDAPQPGFALDWSQIAAFAILDRELSDAEMVTESGRSGWSIGLRSDPAVDVAWSAAGYTAGANAQTEVTPKTLTLAGSVAKTAIDPSAYTRHSLIGQSWYDTSAPVLDASGLYERTDAFAEFAFATDSDEVLVEFHSPIRTFAASYADIGVFNGASFVTKLELIIPFDDHRRIGRAALGSAGVSKTVRVVNGPSSSSAVTKNGCYACAVYLPKSRSFTPAAVTAPTRRLVVWGDSITVGGNSTTPHTEAAVMLIRGDYPGRVAVPASGFRSFAMDKIERGSVAAVAQYIASLCDGTSVNEIWLAMGTNDFGLNQWATVAAFKADYKTLLTELRARTSAKIWAQSPLTRTDVATNGFGHTIAQYRTAISEAVSETALTDCTYVDGTTLASSGNFDPDKVHLTTVGQAEWKASIKTTIAY